MFKKFPAQFYLWMATVMALVFSTGCVSTKEKSASAPSPFYLGADISTLTEVDQRGGVYMDGDKPGDALAIFMKHGWNCFRVRIWVDPRNGDNGLAYTVKLAQRIKQSGGTLMLDFHYSGLVGGPTEAKQTGGVGELGF